MSRFAGQKRITSFSSYPQVYLSLQKIIALAEGGFQKQHGDKGNWTGGAVGVGKLVGTNFGISAMSYPDLDIPNITKEEAVEIYFHDYFLAAGCDKIHGERSPMHFALAACVLDTAVLNGRGNATRYLQKAVGVADDGKWGPISQAALEKIVHPCTISQGLAEACASFSTSRLDMMRRLSNWGTYGGGWSIRVAALVPRAIAQFYEDDVWEKDAQSAPYAPLPMQATDGGPRTEPSTNPPPSCPPEMEALFSYGAVTNHFAGYPFRPNAEAALVGLPHTLENNITAGSMYMLPSGLRYVAVPCFRGWMLEAHWGEAKGVAEKITGVAIPS